MNLDINTILLVVILTIQIGSLIPRIGRFGYLIGFTRTTIKRKPRGIALLKRLSAGGNELIWKINILPNDRICEVPGCNEKAKKIKVSYIYRISGPKEFCVRHWRDDLKKLGKNDNDISYIDCPK